MDDDILKRIIGINKRYVLYKEKNMILTEKNLSRRHGILFPQPERQKKVQKSMAAIRTVLGERKRDAIAKHALKMSLQEEGLYEQEQEKEEKNEVEEK